MEDYGQLPVWGWGSQNYHGGNPSHYAVDIGFFKNGNSDVVVAAWSGTVIYEGVVTDIIDGKKYYPIVVIMQHEGADATYYTRYWHLEKTTCSIGQSIKQGEQIGVRDSTGYSGGKHLHFEVKRVAKGMTYQQTLNKGWNYGNVNPADYIYVFPGQKWENGDAFNLPNKPTIVKPVPVARDTTKHQVQVIAEQLRVRDASGAYYCLCPVGIYNVISQSSKTIGASVYVCDEIESGKWIATFEGWTKDLPIEDKDAIIKKLTEENIEITKKYNDCNSELIKTQTLLAGANGKISKAKEVLE